MVTGRKGFDHDWLDTVARALQAGYLRGSWSAEDGTPLEEKEQRAAGGKKPLNKLGGVQAIGRRYRAWMKVLGRREWGPTRAFERKATADMALMRAAATPEAVRTIAGRLRALAAVGTIAWGLRAEAAAIAGSLRAGAAAQRRGAWRHRVLRKECYLKTTRGPDWKFEKDMPEALLLKKWPKFLRLEMKLPKPTAAEVLANLRLMCPCAPATHEGIAAIVEQEGPFKTPEWIGRLKETSIPSPDLSIAEVEVINKVYLDLKKYLGRWKYRG